MKTATELYEISKKQAPKMVSDILHGVREHVIQRCEEEAKLKGATYYVLYLKQGHAFIKDLLLEECIKLVKEFEDNGYKVTIEDDGNGYYVNFIIIFSWGEKINLDDRIYRNSILLYTTNSSNSSN